MKRIINGKKYDTETATPVCHYSYSNTGDFHFVRKTLYRKKNGEFFIHGRGGAASEFAEQIDCNTWCGGEKMFVVTEDTAREFAEKYATVDQYEEVFGEVQE